MKHVLENPYTFLNISEITHHIRVNFKVHIISNHARPKDEKRYSNCPKYRSKLRGAIRYVQVSTLYSKIYRLNLKAQQRNKYLV